MSPVMRQLLDMVLAQFHGKSSPQLQREYRMGRPVALRAADIVAYLDSVRQFRGPHINLLAREEKIPYRVLLIS